MPWRGSELPGERTPSLAKTRSLPARARRRALPFPPSMPSAPSLRSSWFPPVVLALEAPTGGKNCNRLDLFFTEPQLTDYNTGYRDSHRSEEHTSELQSLRHLVCRLLLEKKKNKI